MNKLTQVANAKPSGIIMEIVCAALIVVLLVGGFAYITMQ